MSMGGDASLEDDDLLAKVSLLSKGCLKSFCLEGVPKIVCILLGTIYPCARSILLDLLDLQVQFFIPASSHYFNLATGSANVDATRREYLGRFFLHSRDRKG
jgi:hypothetical protein